MAIHHLVGSALEPVRTPAIIPHIVNDLGLWGSGFVLAVSRINPEPERQYLAWKNICIGNLPLGECQVVQIDLDTWVVNMVAQHGVRIIDGIPPLRIDALRSCLREVNEIAKEKGASIHAPRIGAVRSGGCWRDIEKVILDTITVDIYIYTLEIEKNMWDTKYEDI
jgi:hypothetical protein